MLHSTVLIIDDEPDLLELIGYNLKKEGALVKMFTSGYEAILQARTTPPDVIVCDWIMPEMDGMELCRTLKRDVNTFEIPIVMLSGKGDEIDIVSALEVGVEDYLVKPVRIKELIARINKIILRNKKSQQALRTETPLDKPVKHLKATGLEINLDKYEVYLQGKLLELTHSEFKLLQLLVSKPGKVYSRNQIIEKLNGFDYYATERSVDVHVVGLRKKLGKFKSTIETVRSVGYRFQEQNS